MNEIIVVEQGRINWRREYCVVTYAVVDSMETARYLVTNALKEYEAPKAAIEQLAETCWKVNIPQEIGPAKEYFFEIKVLVPQTIDGVKKALQNLSR